MKNLSFTILLAFLASGILAGDKIDTGCKNKSCFKCDVDLMTPFCNECWNSYIFTGARSTHRGCDLESTMLPNCVRGSHNKKDGIDSNTNTVIVVTTKTCSQCKKGFYLDTSKNECIANQFPDCVKQRIYSGTIKCEICENGKEPSTDGTTCQSPSQPVGGCITYERRPGRTPQCEECDTNRVLDNDRNCVANEIGVTGCLKLDSRNKCQYCNHYKGYFSTGHNSSTGDICLHESHNPNNNNNGGNTSGNTDGNTTGNTSDNTGGSTSNTTSNTSKKNPENPANSFSLGYTVKSVLLLISLISLIQLASH